MLSANRSEPGGDDATSRGQIPDVFTDMGTLGVEEEFVAVDATGRPAPGVDDLMYESDLPPALLGRLDQEMYTCIVETKTPVCADPADLRGKLSKIRDALVRHAGRHGLGITAAGVHPMAGPGCVDISAKQRYRSMLDRIAYPQQQNTATGLHVHVGVDDPDKAAWIASRLRWYVPVVLALSANSPFYDGKDTGLASMRGHLLEGLPRSGIPPAFEQYDDFARFEERMVETDSMPERGQLWWDVRPHPEHGTVEIRAPDAQRDVETIVAMAEFLRELVLDLSDRYEDDESLDPLQRDFLDENKWRAIRHGHDASFVDRDGSGVAHLSTVVERLCDRLGVDGLRDVLYGESGAARQRRLYRQGGLEQLCMGLRLSGRYRTPSAGTASGRFS